MVEPRPRVAVCGTAGGWSTERLADALAVETGFRLIVDPGALVLDLSAGTVRAGEADLGAVDAVIVKKLGGTYGPAMLDRLEVLRYLESRGVEVHSSPNSMMRLLDRLACTVELAMANVPLPPTLVTEEVDEAVDAIRRFESAVLKPLFSTKARGMRIVDGGDRDEVVRAVTEYRREGHHVFYIQKKLELGDRDFGICFLGGEPIGAYARVNRGSAWNTTIAAGGRYEAYHPPREIMDLADRARRVFDQTFASVDVAITPEGPVVFEVSAFGGFRGLMEGAGVDAAALYAAWIRRRFADGRS